MPEWKEETITIRTRSTLSIETDAHVIGGYAIHPQKEGHPGWSVTHLASGLQIWRTYLRDKAAEIALWLSLHSPLPIDADTQSLVQWSLDNPRAITNLRIVLVAIAPKWPPVTPDDAVATVRIDQAHGPIEPPPAPNDHGEP